MRKMNELTVKKNYGLLDVMKFVMSILVVTIHRPIGNISNLFVYEELYVLARLAVPFFFTSSAFLFFDKLKNTENKSAALEKYEFRILRLYVIWNVLYFPSVIYRYRLVNHYSWAETFSEMLKFENVLWFLPVLAAAVAAVYYGVKKNAKATGIIAAVFLILSIIAGYKEFYLVNFTNKVNFFFSGIPYVFLGYLIAERKKNLSLKTSIVIFAVSIIMSLAEGYIEFRFLSDTFFGFSRIFYLPTIYSLMLICLNVQTKERKIYLIFRKLSMFIYFIHLIIYQEMIWVIFHITGLDNLCKIPITGFAFTIFYVAIACVLLLLLEDKKGFRWLKNLY